MSRGNVRSSPAKVRRRPVPVVYGTKVGGGR